MRRIIAIFAAILALSLPGSCIIGGHGGVRVIGGCTEKGIDCSDERLVEAFSTLSSSGPFNVYHVQSPTSKVLVEGKQEFVEKVQTKVNGGKLSVKLEDGTYRNLVLKVTVYSPLLDEVNWSGSGNFIDLSPRTTAGDFHFSLAGSGNYVGANIECHSFSAKISGSGTIKANEIVSGDVDIHTSGSGRSSIEKLVSTGNVSISHSGSGNSRIEDADIAGNLKCRISGSGNIVVNGKAGSVDASISGSGDIHGALECSDVHSNVSGSGKVRFSK